MVHFPAQNTLDCRILHMKSQNLKNVSVSDCHHVMYDVSELISS